MKQYLIIEPYINIFLGSNKALLYNVLDGKCLEYNEKKCLRLLQRISDIESMYRIEIQSDDMNDPMVKSFIKDLQDNFFGELIETDHLPPVQLHPLLNFQRETKRLEKEGYYSSLGDYVMHYLKEVTIYLNNDYFGKPIDLNIHKQFIFPVYERNQKSILRKEFISIISQIRGTIEIINILGGDLFKCSFLDEACELLKEIDVHINILLYSKESKFKEKIEYFNDFQLSIIIDDYHKGVEDIISENRSQKFIFVVKNNDEFKIASGLSDKWGVENFEFSPLYSGENLDFFKENIFLSKDDILSEKQSQNDIFAKQQLNINFFGKLVIMSNGLVYSNLYMPSLGNIKENSLKELIHLELQGEKSWLWVKKNVKPCNDCCYHAICAPITNYEMAIGEMNLCKLE